MFEAFPNTESSGLVQIGADGLEPCLRACYESQSEELEADRCFAVEYGPKGCWIWKGDASFVGTRKDAQETIQYVIISCGKSSKNIKAQNCHGKL